MYKILDRVDYSDDVYMQVIEAPAVAAACLPGQFIILRIDEEGERIPLTIADFDRDAGTITIVVQAIGKSTRQLQKLGKGNSLANFIGPLGIPSEIEKVGTVVCVWHAATLPQRQAAAAVSAWHPSTPSPGH